MVTLQCTHHDLSVNDGNAVPDELMHGDAVLNELMDGDRYRARYQITDVTRRLNSASRVCDQGTMCSSRRLEGASSIMRLVGAGGSIRKTERMCCTHVLMNHHPENVNDGQVSFFLGPSARFL